MTKSLEVTGLVWGFGERRLGGPLTLTFQPGVLTAILGPNGIGKTCLAQTLAGLIKPIEGQIAISGENLASLNSAKKAEYLAFLPQRDAADLSYTVTDAVMAGRYRFSHGLVSNPTDQKAVSEAIGYVELEPYAQTPLAKLSGGEQQRVKLARALVQETPIVILDEPGVHLDMGQHHKLGLLLKKLTADNKTVVVVSHDVEWCRNVANQVCLLGDNGQTDIGKPQEVLTEQRIAQAFGLPMA